MAKHILYIPSWYPNPFTPLNGTFFREQAEPFVERGHKVGVLAPYLRPAQDLVKGGWCMGFTRGREDGLLVYRYYGLRFPKMPRLARRAWVNAATKLFDQYVADQGMPDLIHAHSAVWGGYVAARLANRHRVPYVLTEHSSGFARGLYTGWYLPGIHYALSSAQRLLAVSSPLGECLKQYCRRDDISIIPNYIDTYTFRPADSRRSGSRFRFICIARLRPKKSIDLLLRAFAHAFHPSEAAVLDIVGDGPERRNLEDEANRLGLRPRVHFHGALDRLTVRDRLQNSDCCVSSSQVETFGVTLIEALATGLPVVATRSGGPEDIVDEESGLLVPTNDRSALAGAMRSIYDNRDLWRARRNELRQRAVDHFSKTAVVSKLDEVYDEALKAQCY